MSNRPDDLVGYTYRADLYCPLCILSQPGLQPGSETHAAWVTESILTLYAKQRGIDRDDESTFDSGEFPKVVFRDMLSGDSDHSHVIVDKSQRPDYQDRCGACGKVLGS